MTDPGWDIPGIARDTPPGPQAVTPDVRTAARARRAARQAGAVCTSTGTGTGETVRDARQALSMLDAALEFLAHADPAEWLEGAQADCLRALAVAESRQAAAHARVLSAFSAPGGGLAADGHRSARTWLSWQTQATRRAATTSVAWMRRLQAHPALGAALADGQLSLSWARQLAEWTDLLPADARQSADEQLLAAAAAGAALSDLYQLAEHLRREHATPDADDDHFTDRSVRVATTFDGAGRLEGDLTARCAAAVTTVLDSLAAAHGPEDIRTLAQRRHDALEDACLRLLAADCLPQRAGQPVRLNLDITLNDLAAHVDGAMCDALIQPFVTGHTDYERLHALIDPASQHAPADTPAADTASASAGDATSAARNAGLSRSGMLLEQAITLLSGPSGAAALLRRQFPGMPAVPVSLPLDIPGTIDTIPVHLRRAVRKRDQHCRFAGCDTPPDACDVHHIVHRKDGGRHAVSNLILLCRFHHHIAIHRWGWIIRLNPDGTTTAVSASGDRTLHSHASPRAA